ncbi:MAG: GntR family transcriptional regulator [Micromonosporaceae bacterium]|nr:GntR family transcriptional regulator [Micromonosporaceae bacterium]
MQLQQPKLADLVARTLRDRILSGELQDGDELPRQEDLLREFGVSKPSLREALRILEAEGLATVRRGNRGGAVVHVPKAQNAAFMIGLTLQFRGVPLADVGHALRAIEPVCAGLCAARDDRDREVVPALREIQQATQLSVGDPVEFTGCTRRFHQEIVGRCGNQTLILVVGALEAIWSSPERSWADQATRQGRFPDRGQRLRGIRAHERLIGLIGSGDVERVQRFAASHLRDSLAHMIVDTAGDTVQPLRAPDGPRSAPGAGPAGSADPDDHRLRLAHPAADGDQPGPTAPRGEL